MAFVEPGDFGCEIVVVDGVFEGSEAGSDRRDDFGWCVGFF